jgi:hypothetical protein
VTFPPAGAQESVRDDRPLTPATGFTDVSPAKSGTVVDNVVADLWAIFLSSTPETEIARTMKEYVVPAERPLTAYFDCVVDAMGWLRFDAR